MTVDEILDRIGRVMAERWMVEVDWNRDTFTGFLAHGCPAEYAKVLRDLFGIPLETWPKVLHAPKSLTRKLTRVNTNGVTDEHRINIAKGQKPGDKFMSAIAAKGFTQGQLAAAVGVNPALLSMYRSGKRPIPEARAKRIEELAGWKATLRNWPGGIVS